MKKIYLLFLLFMYLNGQSYAQLSDRLTKLPPSEVKKYATPLATWMGTYFNSAGYYTADIAKTFGFKISIVGMMIFVPDDQTTFTPAPFEGYTGDEKTATFFGDKGAAIAGPNGFIAYPPGINKTSIPAGIPQIAASFMGTEVMLRYFPKLNISDVEVSLLGLGLKHSISQYIPLLPVNISVQILYNKFSAEHPNVKIETSNFAFNAHASKSFGLFSLYGGLQYETTNLDLEYTFDGAGFPGINDGEKVKIDMDGDNNIRLTLGFALKLAVLVINADYNIGSQNVLVAGVNFEL